MLVSNEENFMYGVSRGLYTGRNGSGFRPVSVSQLCTTLYMEYEGHFMGLTP